MKRSTVQLDGDFVCVCQDWENLKVTPGVTYRPVDCHCNCQLHQLHYIACGAVRTRRSLAAVGASPARGLTWKPYDLPHVVR